MSEGIVLPAHPHFKNLTGQRFGRLVVVSFAGVIGRRTRWNCVCDCGTKRVVVAAGLIAGTPKSCGCLHADVMHAKASPSRVSRRPEYFIWKTIKQRCINRNDKSWHNYGGRGVQICEEWRNSFAAFINDMGNRPSDQHTVERINNNGNYEPGNCRWATRKEQAVNTRRNHLVTIDGVTKPITHWARLVGLSVSSIIERMAKGWSDSDAVMLKAGEVPH